MSTVGVVTGARADYGHLRPVMSLLRDRGELDLHVIVTGMHLAPQYGDTITRIEQDGFRIRHRVESILASDTPQGTAKSIAAGVAGFAQVFSGDPPDVLLLLGDRFETWAAAIAATPFAIPIAHIHGGELTIGAMDEAIRHSITKLSHIHFVATEEYAQRVMQLGEEPWRVSVTGAPGLDNLRALTLLDRSELEKRIRLKVAADTLLVTFHPVTLDRAGNHLRIKALLGALEEIGRPVIFTAPNADAGGHEIRAAIFDHTQNHADANLVINAGTDVYFSLMSHVAAMVGNSSSGIIEAASFGLPVVDIGDRQAGRVRPPNVIHCAEDTTSIVDAIRRATAGEFRSSLAGMKNPYGDGMAAERIVSRLADLPYGPNLMIKHFHDFSRDASPDSPRPA